MRQYRRDVPLLCNAAGRRQHRGCLSVAATTAEALLDAMMRLQDKISNEPSSKALLSGNRGESAALTAAKEGQ